MNEKEEVELIAKLVSQQMGLVQALSECQNSKNQLSLQFIKILKAIVLKNNGDFVIEKESIKFLVDSMSFQYLIGAEIDVEEGTS